MIEIIPKNKSKKKIDPYYELVYHYMIGDANGSTSEEVSVSIDNPYLERFIVLLNNLKPNKGHWGIQLSGSEIKQSFKEGNLSEDDYKFLEGLLFEGSDVFEEEDEFAMEFYEGVRADTEYSFLVFKGVTLKYVDEFGEKHNTKIV